MALGVDRDKFKAMVNYFRANIGGVLSVAPPKPGELIRNKSGELVKPIQATKDPDELHSLVYHYLENYKYYPDEPLIEFNNEKTYLFILPPVENGK